MYVSAGSVGDGGEGDSLMWFALLSQVFFEFLAGKISSSEMSSSSDRHSPFSIEGCMSKVN